jgi:5'-phosphate synthase pdxT subunit
MRIGVLALQGGFAPHLAMLGAIGRRAVEVRAAHDLVGVEGLVLPGGESTVQYHLLERDAALRRALFDRIDAGLPILATCAGLIVAARFGWIDVTVRRNAYGRQQQSSRNLADDGETALVMIRAPRIEGIGKGVEVLATLRGEPVLVRDRQRFGATFHPELSESTSVHARVFG